MKKIFQFIKLGLLVPVSVLAFVTCSENKMDEINTNGSVAKDADAIFLLPDLELRTAQNIVGGDMNTYFGVYIEHWTGTHNQLYRAEKRYAEVRIASTFNNSWGDVFANIRNGKIILAKCADDAPGKDAGNKSVRGAAEILLAYNLAVATDVFGNVPYTEVGDVDKFPFPKADTQEDIYKEVFRLLDAGIADIASGKGTPLSKYDFIYGGDAALWEKFANGLKARYTLRLINKSTDKSGDYDDILTYIGNSFADASEQASIQYDGSNQNPTFDFEWSRDAISASASMHAKLKARHDPRAERVYYDPYYWIAYTSDEVAPKLAPVGDPDECQYVYAYDAFVYGEIAPVHLLSYHELLFIKAEVEARKADNNSAKATLQDAIAAAFDNFEVNVSAAQNAPSLLAYGGLDDFAQAPLTAADAAAYYTADVDALFTADPLQEILIQKYIAQWGANGEALESYADVRRLKAEGKGAIYSLANPGKFPLRAPYGQDDVVANPNIKALYTDGGNYVFSEPVWWAGGTR